MPPTALKTSAGLGPIGSKLQTIRDAGRPSQNAKAGPALPWPSFLHMQRYNEIIRCHKKKELSAKTDLMPKGIGLDAQMRRTLDVPSRSLQPCLWHILTGKGMRVRKWKVLGCGKGQVHLSARRSCSKSLSISRWFCSSNTSASFNFLTWSCNALNKKPGNKPSCPQKTPIRNFTGIKTWKQREKNWKTKAENEPIIRKRIRVFERE